MKLTQEDLRELAHKTCWIDPITHETSTDVTIALLEDIIGVHSMPDNGGSYNECDQTKCWWCERAEELIDFLRTDSQRHDPNPWRYPSRGELPPKRAFYLCTVYEWFSRKRRCEIIRWTSSRWLTSSIVAAWRELPEPAPELEEKEK